MFENMLKGLQNLDTMTVSVGVETDEKVISTNNVLPVRANLSSR
jgi:hypothetical protein